MKPGPCVQKRLLRTGPASGSTHARLQLSMRTIQLWDMDLSRAVTGVTWPRDVFRNSLAGPFETDCCGLLQQELTERGAAPACHCERSAVAKRERAVEEPYHALTSWAQYHSFTLFANKVVVCSAAAPRCKP